MCGVLIEKNFKRDFLATLFLSLTSSFMFFIHEPISMYANNMNDFWFDLSILLKPTILAFLITFITVFLVSSVIYLICAVCKKPNFYLYFLVFVTFGFICCYIHGNFLSGFLPPLDGSTIDWTDSVANIVSIIICLLSLVVAIIACIKLKPEILSKICIFTPIMIFGMLVVSLISIVMNPDVTKDKDVIFSATEKNLDVASSDENFMILLVDAVDSYHFNKIVKSSPEYTDVFKDFSYYPDTLSGYAFTRDSIPFIFSGIWNENKKPFSEYSTDAFNNSKFLNSVFDKRFNANFYDYDFVWNDKKVLNFANVSSVSKNIKNDIFIKQEIKYILFKYLPQPLKRFSSITTMNYAAAQNIESQNPFEWGNIDFYDDHLKKPIEKTNEKVFQYIHIEGGHTPFDITENLEKLPNEDGTYEQKLEATMRIIRRYLERLKDADAYNNSTIVIMADHGFWYAGTDRQNPILYIKGINEQHDEMLFSEKQISYEDLCNAFIELLDHKSSTEIFDSIPTDGRVRRYLYNGFNEEEHMYEYEQTGKAWDTGTLIKTGRSFDL